MTRGLDAAAASDEATSIIMRCPVCEGACALLDVVDFNKSCEELRGAFLPLAGVPVYYARCGYCGFCHAPELYLWSLEEFSERIYNSSYLQVDPDYLEVRPKGNADHLIRLIGPGAAQIRHLDYGGGHGLLSDLLRDSGWQSQSYDPFVDRETAIAELGQFDLITAYEVFEHVPDVRGLAANLSQLLAPEGIVIFSTLLSEGNLAANRRITWWYASPRNGHISLFTRDSLYRLAAREGLNFGSFSPNLHVFWRTIPRWAAHFLTAS